MHSGTKVEESWYSKYLIFIFAYTKIVFFRIFPNLPLSTIIFFFLSIDVLPAPQEEGPDAQGIKTITSFRRNDKGQVEKVSN
jgi:hypothetical protein